MKIFNKLFCKKMEEAVDKVDRAERNYKEAKDFIQSIEKSNPFELMRKEIFVLLENYKYRVNIEGYARFSEYNDIESSKILNEINDLIDEICNLAEDKKNAL